MPEKPNPLPSAGEKIPDITDPNGAPLIFFDGVSNMGTSRGVVNLTLFADRHLLIDGQVKVDLVATAFIRCTVPVAIALRAAIDKALLLGAPVEGDVN